jgi:hypothetical protein
MSRSVVVLTAAAALTGCAVGSGPESPSTLHAGEIIEISVGPCFGFCPVYDVRVGADGLVVFDGERHTAIVGERRRSAGPQTYRTLADDLAPFRPTPGTEGVVACDAAISDTSSYTITWTDTAGHRSVATHRSGCTGGPGLAPDQVLHDLQSRLGIGDWARQVTRLGASRG